MAIAFALAASLTAFAGTAEAKEVTTAPPVMTSLPFVEDVNPASNGAYTATVVCYGGGGAFELKATDMKLKRTAKAKRVGVGQWVVRMKPGREYKLSVRVKGTSWKSIGYRIY